MQTKTLRRWSVVHTWTSLVCTLFLLVVCITGLPVLFQQELWKALVPDNDPPYAVLPAGTPALSLDTIVAKARAMYPGQIIRSVARDDDEPQVMVFMAPSWAALEEDAKHPDHPSGHWISFDARTAQIREQSRPWDAPKPPRTWTAAILGTCYRLHVSLFAGFPGRMFLAVMAAAFVMALVSGAVAYAPFIGKFGFGTVRVGRTRRIRWLDLHNLLGMATLTWMLVVGFTGLVNELQEPLFDLWRATDARTIFRPWEGQPPLSQAQLSSVQAAFDTVQRALPHNTVNSVTFPGSPNGSPHHYFFWTQGNTPLTAHLFDPVLVNAQTGRLTMTMHMPWYLRALELSRPLHFGDYGGMPLKVLWALLDVATIIVLGSGLSLWWSRRHSPSPAGRQVQATAGNQA